MVRYQILDNVTEVVLKFHKCNETDIKEFFPPSLSFNEAIPQAWKRGNFYCLDRDQEEKVVMMGNDATNNIRFEI